MTTKEINRESGRYFASLLLPNWALRSQEDQEDYGVDSEIELTSQEDKATGIIFKIQLKGTSVAKFNKHGELVFSDASVERFSYYLSSLRIPIIFVVCDVITGNCYWMRVQGNRKLESDLASAVAKNQETFTIKIPVAQQLLKTANAAERVLEIVEDSSNVITLRGLKSLSSESVREHIENEPDLAKTEKQFRFFAGLTANESIQKLLVAGEVDAACEKAQNLLESSAESPEIRVLGGWNLARCMNVKLRRSGEPGSGIKGAQYKLGIGSRMLEIVRSNKCETSLKRYSQIFVRAARMHIYSRSALALATSEKLQEEQGVTMSAPFTRIQRMEVSALVARDFFKLQNGLYRLGEGGFFSVMPYALSEVTESIFPHVAALRMLGNEELADAYVNALFDFLPFCLDVTRRYESQRDVEEILSSLGIRFIGLSNIADAQTMLKRYGDALDGEPPFACADSVKGSLRKQVEELQERSKKKVDFSFEELRNSIADRAVELGINLDDPVDQIAQVVRIGLEDLDPTRVSKNCKHIHVISTSFGVPAEKLGLPTAGFKRVICLKHGHSFEALRLDDAYESFRGEQPWDAAKIRCCRCPDTEPHSDEWHWSYDWDAEQRARHRKADEKQSSEDGGGEK